MSMSELCIHTIGEKAPKVGVDKYSDFHVVEIKAGTLPTIKLFFYSAQKAVNFKNNILWAFENSKVMR